jgi:hypothetical protein
VKICKVVKPLVAHLNPTLLFDLCKLLAINLQGQIEYIKIRGSSKVKATGLKWIRETCGLIFKVNNMLSLHELDLELLKVFLEAFYSISFSDD